MKVETKKIINFLNLTKKIVKNKSYTLPILNHYRFLKIADKIIISCSNLDLSAEINLTCNFYPVDQKINCCLSAKIFNSVIQSIKKSEFFDLSFSENKIFINQAELSTISGDEIPEYKKNADNILIDLMLKENRDSIKNARSCSSEDKTRYNLNGINVDRDYFTATDGHRLAKQVIKESHTSPDFKSAIIHNDFIDLLLSIKNPAGRILIDQKMASYEDQDLRVYSSLIDADYPAVNLIKLANNPTTITADHRGLLEAIDQVQAIFNKKTKENGIRLEAKNNILKIAGHSAEYGEITKQIQVSSNKDLEPIGINVEYLRSAIAHSPGYLQSDASININFGSKLDPIFIGRLTGDYFVVMPMKL